MADFRALFESPPGLYLVLSPELRIVAVTDAYLRATMTNREEILGLCIFDVFPDNPEDPAATGVRNLRESLERVLQRRRPDAMAVQKYDVRRPAGEGGQFETRYWSPLNSPVLNAAGEVAYIIHRVEDVTDFIRLKQAGRETEEQRQALATRAEQMEAEIFARAQEVAETNRQLRSVNEQSQQLYQQMSTLMSQADEQLTGDGPDGAWESGRELMAPEEMLGRIGQMIAGHARMEAQLRQAQKMEAIGLLAGGVAHDFNNLLTVISGYSSLLAERLPAGFDTTELEEIEHAAMRAAALTRKLLAFSRKQVLQPRVIDVNAVVSGMEELLRRLIGERILLVTALSGNLGRVHADPSQLEQVIMNLAVNARDAMPSGGRLIIETANRTVGADEVGSLPAGSYVVLSVTDSGHGMDEATAARIFEPFFTTKEVGRGTGLGLSTAFGIARQSGGTLFVESKPGQGAKFCVCLPCVEGELDASDSALAAAPQTVVHWSVLVVEDEAPLRRLVATVLAAAGHRVLTAANGDEALALATRDRIDLLITDVVMPGMNGPEIAAKLRPMFTNLPVLYMSGYDRNLVDTQALEGNAGFVAKPFTPRALLAAIQELQIAAHPRAESRQVRKRQR